MLIGVTSRDIESLILIYRTKIYTYVQKYV